MEYKTVVLKYNPRAKKMAEEVEKIANEYAKEGWKLLTFSVTLSAKAHLRNGRPVIVAVSSNDALAANAENIGKLLNRKNFYFVPFGQDDAEGKPRSLVAEMEKIPQTLALALDGIQIQPILS